MPRQLLRVVVVLGLVATATVGTGGYSAITLDRTVTVGTVDDHRPPVTVTACRANATTRVSVTNHEERPLSVQLVARETTVVFLDPGDHQQTTLGGTTDAVTARLTVDDVTIELTRPVTNPCRA